MAATKVQLNWSSVQFAATTITRVTNATFTFGGNILLFSGDANIYDVVGAVGVNKPAATVTSADIGTLSSFQIGAQGTLAAQLNDALQQTGGAVVFTMTNAIVSDIPSSAAHAAFGTGTISFVAVSTDGVTPPLTIGRV